MMGNVPAALASHAGKLSSTVMVSESVQITDAACYRV